MQRDELDANEVLIVKTVTFAESNRMNFMLISALGHLVRVRVSCPSGCCFAPRSGELRVLIAVEVNGDSPLSPVRLELWRLCP